MSAVNKLAGEIRETINRLGCLIDEFNREGGQFNLRVYHNEGSESIDLHQLSGELEPQFFKVEEL